MKGNTVNQIVKLGGSALTHKRILETVNDNVLKQVAAQLAEAKDSRIIVHGAGSFGHFQAKQYQIHQGDSHPEFAKGFAETRLSVTKLNHILVTELNKHGIPAIGIPPFPTTTLSMGELESIDMKPFEHALDLGLTPVTHGDAVFDTQRGSSIVSGDPIVARLAEIYKPKRVIFMMDVLGVLRAPPGENSTHENESSQAAELIRLIEASAEGSFKLPKTAKLAHDVTEGIHAKIRYALDIASNGIPVYMVQAGSNSALQALRGEEPDTATKIS